LEWLFRDHSASTVAKACSHARRATNVLPVNPGGHPGEIIRLAAG
jgi:hypothetical protein